MTRDSENSPPPTKEQISEGKFYAAKFEDGWERVQLIRQSTTTPGGDYWIVYVVDIGFFHLIHKDQLRLLTESVSSFNRILLAKCKVCLKIYFRDYFLIIFSFKELNAMKAGFGAEKFKPRCKTFWNRRQSQR